MFPSPHCVDNAFFATRSTARTALALETRRSYQIPDDAVVFGFVGRLVDMKRPADFVTALAAAAHRGSRVHALIVGDGPLRARLEAISRRAGMPCTFAGFLNQSSIVAAYSVMDALVLPSTAAETWGLVVNEAFASGVPAIVSDAAGCAPDLVVEGETGFTYRCGDVEALAGLIARVAADSSQRQLMRARVRPHIDRFSPERAAAGTLQAVDALRERRGTMETEGRHAVDLVS
jgi:glycosyltransferase involved in cell wall biosynthesis